MSRTHLQDKYISLIYWPMNAPSDPVSESAKAAQEIAKTTVKVIDAAREAGGFIARYIDGPLEQAMGIFDDKLRYMRWERQLRLMRRAQEFLSASGLHVPSRAVPMKLIIPILQGAGLEEDDSLQDRWAALLVNAANASFRGEVRRSYTSILEQLTPLDARILDIVYSVSFEQSQHNGVVTAKLPTSARVADNQEQEESLPSEEILISLSNLVRLGCLRPAATWGGGESFVRVNPTLAGKAFVRACRIAPEIV